MKSYQDKIQNLQQESCLNDEKYQVQIQNLQEENSYLKVENLNVNRINRELQCRADPFSTDGDAICNYDEDE